MSTVQIGQAAALYDLPPSTLRWWERQGVLGEPTHRGRPRRYGERELTRIGMAYLCHVTGLMSLDKTAIVAGTIADAQIRQQVVREEINTLDERIHQMSAARDYLRHLVQCPDDDMTRCSYLQDDLMARTPRGRRGEPDIVEAARRARPARRTS